VGDVVAGRALRPAHSSQEPAVYRQQPPALGRPFAARDCEAGADLVVVLSHELWRTAFGADPGIVGRTIQLNRKQVTVAGVTAEGTYNGSAFLGGGYLAPINAGRTSAPR
jgi:hypothetical protein